MVHFVIINTVSLVLPLQRTLLNITKLDKKHQWDKTMTKYIMSIGLALIAIPVAIASTHSEALRDVKFESRHNIKIKTETLEYRVNYLSTDPNVDKTKIENQILISTNQVLRNFKDKKSCKYLVLNMYDMPYEQLNDKSKMTFIESDYPIDGLYDSKYSDPGYAAIFITNNIDNQTRDDTITHEIAHYLKEVMCIKGDSEAFATSHHD